MKKNKGAIHILIIHIADPAAEAIVKAGIKKIGLLGTKVTMEEPFYKERLLNRMSFPKKFFSD